MAALICDVGSARKARILASLGSLH